MSDVEIITSNLPMVRLTHNATRYKWNDHLCGEYSFFNFDEFCVDWTGEKTGREVRIEMGYPHYSILFYRVPKKLETVQSKYKWKKEIGIKMSFDDQKRLTSVDVFKNYFTDDEIKQHIKNAIACLIEHGYLESYVDDKNLNNQTNQQTGFADCFISKQAAMQIAHELQISVDGYHMYNQAINNYCAEIADLTEAIVRCKDCMHNGSFDTDCPIYWPGKEFCNFGERKDDE